MDRRGVDDMDSGINPCLNCIGSCCKPEVDVTREEYEDLKSKGYEKEIQTRSEIFIKRYPGYENVVDVLNSMYGESFAILSKSEDGFCRLLDRATRLCSIYDSRPKVCRDFEVNSNRCNSIKKCIN